jgi:uncharacterized membrane protein
MRLDDTERLEAFSDGVMAVIITIMAFNVKPPNGASLTAIHGVLPHLLVYVLSFTMIGIYWNNHHHLLRATDRMDGSVMWANMFLLFWLSLLPIVTAWVGKFPNHALPAAFYGLISLGAGFAYWILVRMIIRANGTDSMVARAVGSDLKGNLSVAIYAAGTALAFVTPVASYVLYACVAVMWFVPDRRFADPWGDRKNRVTPPGSP